MVVCSLTLLIMQGCGSGGNSSSAIPLTNTPSSAEQWAQIDGVTFRSNIATNARIPWIANVYGTAWVSHSWAGYRNDGNGMNDDPGVVVTFVNQTTGDSGTATSYYGWKTNWVHSWSAQVPVVTGNNTIQIKAYDPSGKGGSLTKDIFVQEDPVAPSIPTDLTAYPISDTEMQISWKPSTDNVAVTGYRIRRWNATTYDVNNFTTSADVISFKDTWLTQHTRYCYSLYAYDAAGNESTGTQTACATTMSLITDSWAFDQRQWPGWKTTGSWAVVYDASSAVYSITDSPVGNYANNSDNSLVSPLLNLAGYQRAILVFYHRHSINPWGSDYGYVEISTDGGVTFGPYVRRYTGATYTGTLSSYEQEPGIDLPTSSAVVIRFRLVADATYTDDGWYIRNIMIIPL
jgi:hypothetical protein